MLEMDIQKILKYLPHRYPMLMIDRVLTLEPGKRIVAMKNVSANEPYFQGHFPNRPIMPGVLILEGMAQAALLLAFGGREPHAGEDQVYYYVGIDNARFKRPATSSSSRSASTGCCVASASSPAWRASPVRRSPRPPSSAP